MDLLVLKICNSLFWIGWNYVSVVKRYGFKGKRGKRDGYGGGGMFNVWVVWGWV